MVGFDIREGRVQGVRVGRELFAKAQRDGNEMELVVGKGKAKAKATEKKGVAKKEKTKDGKK